MNNAQLHQIAAEVALDLKLVWYSGDKKVFVGLNNADTGVWRREIGSYERHEIIDNVMKHPTVASEVTALVLQSTASEVHSKIDKICFDGRKPLFRKELKAEIAKRGEGCMAVQAETKVMIWQREGQALKEQVAKFQNSLTTQQLAEFQDIISKIESRMRRTDGSHW